MFKYMFTLFLWVAMSCGLSHAEKKNVTAAKEEFFTQELFAVLYKFQGCRITDQHSIRERILYCIENGADVNVQNDYGRTPFYYAAVYRCFAALAIFDTCDVDLTIRDKAGWTVLHTVSQLGYDDVIQYILGLECYKKNAQHFLDMRTPNKYGHQWRNCTAEELAKARFHGKTVGIFQRERKRLKEAQEAKDEKVYGVYNNLSIVVESPNGSQDASPLVNASSAHLDDRLRRYLHPKSASLVRRKSV